MWMGLFPDICVCVYVCVISVVDILPKKERQKKENTQRWSEKHQRCLVQRCLKLLGNLLLPVYFKKKSAKNVIKKQ